MTFNSRKEYYDYYGKFPTYTVLRLRLANFLSSHGIMPIDVHADARNPRYNVFVYRTDEALLNCLYDWFILGVR